MKRKWLWNLLMMSLVISLMGYTAFADTNENDILEDNEDETESVLPFEMYVVLQLEDEMMIGLNEAGIITSVDMITSEVSDEVVVEVPAVEPLEEATDVLSDEPSDETAVADPVDEPSESILGLTFLEGLQVLINDHSEAFSMTIVSNDETAADALKASIMEAFPTLSVELEIIEVDTDEENDHIKERFENALKYGVTNGKMNLIEKLAFYSNADGFDFELWSTASVKDIMKTIKNSKKENYEWHKEDNDDEDQLDAEREKKMKSEDSDGKKAYKNKSKK